MTVDNIIPVGGGHFSTGEQELLLNLYYNLPYEIHIQTIYSAKFC